MPSVEENLKDHLLNNVKKEVKQLMEYSVTCKFIHENNSCLTSLCLSIDSCLLHGLKKDFLHKRTTYNLLKRISKECDEARLIVHVCENLKDTHESVLHKNTKLNDIEFSISPITKIFSNESNDKSSNIDSVRSYEPLFESNLSNLKLFWIKVAIIEKSLMNIIECIQKNAHKFYHRYALMADASDAAILSSLVDGPCALEYTRFKACDGLMSEQNADELIQRHKMHSYLLNNGTNTSSNSLSHSGKNQHHNDHQQMQPKTPANSVFFSPVKSPKVVSNTNTLITNGAVTNSSNYNPKEYVESLHQNLKSQLVYGKNYISVDKGNKLISGYLSLHSNQNGLILNWTPNELLNVCPDEADTSGKKKNYWKDIIHIEFDTISYFCCNLTLDSESMIIFVAHEGVQYPTIIFQLGSHLIQFLSCLENALQPKFRLEPANWEETLIASKEPVILKKISSNAPPPAQHNNDELDVLMSNSTKSSPLYDDYQFGLNSMQTPMKPKGNFQNRHVHFNLSPIYENSTSIVFTPAVTGRVKMSLLPNHEKRDKLRGLCHDIRYKIMSRAFYGWLNYYRQVKTLKKHLLKLINTQAAIEYDNSRIGLDDDNEVNALLKNYLDQGQKLDDHLWTKLDENRVFNKQLFYQLIYTNGVKNSDVRRKVWPYLLNHYSFEMTHDDIDCKYKQAAENYARLVGEWSLVEDYVQAKEEEERHQLIVAKTQETPINAGQHDDDSGLGSVSDYTSSSSSIGSSGNASAMSDRKLSLSTTQTPIVNKNLSNSSSFVGKDLFNETSTQEKKPTLFFNKFNAINLISKIAGNVSLNQSSALENTPVHRKSCPTVSTEKSSLSSMSVDDLHRELALMLVSNAIMRAKHELELSMKDQAEFETDHASDSINTTGIKSMNKSSIISSPYSPDTMDGSTNVTTNMFSSLYLTSDNDILSNKQLIQMFSMNMQRIDKDVLRCDRNYWYFTTSDNLNKLKNILYTYVWETLDIGYIQGMCDLVAPLLVLFDDEPLVFECFKKLMDRLSNNFIYSSEMDRKFSDMSFLVKVIDHELHEYMTSRGDHTQFYFTYRWFLIDFKREFAYDDMFVVWETIWTAKHFFTDYFHLFVALALIETYRDIIIENQMDFTNIIKFFSEMAEKHDATKVLNLARDSVNTLKEFIVDKN